MKNEGRIQTKKSIEYKEIEGEIEIALPQGAVRERECALCFQTTHKRASAWEGRKDEELARVPQGLQVSWGSECSCAPGETTMSLHREVTREQGQGAGIWPSTRQMISPA